MAWIGLAMDFGVSLVWAVAFTALFANVAFVRRHIVSSGLAFGVAVMVVMIFFVVPLGHAPQMHKTPANLFNVFVAHTVFFGLPVALTVRTQIGSPRFRRRLP